MSTTTIKAEFIERIKEDDALQLKLAECNRVRITSVKRWLYSGKKSGTVKLTTFDSLQILVKHFKLLDSEELLEKESTATGN